MMTFTSGMNNPNYLVEHQQVYFEVRSVNPEYIIKKIVFHCVDNTTSDNLDCFYWGPSTISIVQNWTYPSQPGTYRYSGYTGTWTGTTNKIQFTTMAKPVRFGSVDITFEKETGDIFELVTDDNQLQAGQKYAIVNQYYPTNAEDEGYAMSTLMNDSYSTIGRTKVSFVPNTNKHKVIVNDETRIITLLTGTGVEDRPWYLGTGSSTVKMRRASSQSGGLASTKGYTLSFENIGSYPEFFPVKIEIGAEADNYPAKIRFCDNSANYNKPTDTNYAIGHNNTYEYFKVLDITSTNSYASTQRVHLYRPAQNYIITTERIPEQGGEITLTDGVLEINGQQTSQEFENVSFYVSVNDGYTIQSVTATDANNNPVTIDCTQTTLQGNRYTFTMPAANVNIVVNYVQANYHVIHAECDPTYGGEYTFNSGTFDASNQVVSYPGNNVNFGVTASQGYVFTGITATSEDGQSTVLPLTDNGNGTYGFTMPDNDVTLSATFDRVIGDIFQLVEYNRDIVAGSTYVIVSQTSDKVMKHWNRTETTFQGTPIVEWVTADKKKVRVDDNACFFTLDDFSQTSETSSKKAVMNTLVGYLGYNGTNVLSTPDKSGYNNATMYISQTVSNFLCTFDLIENANICIRYDADGNFFKMVDYTSSPAAERVWLYRLVEDYHNISTVCTPPEGGSITANATSAQAGDPVTFSVTTNEGYDFNGVTVTYTDPTITTPIEVTDNGDGTYSFNMPDNAVTITANFDVLPEPYNIIPNCVPAQGGYMNINGHGNNETTSSIPGSTVNFEVHTNWGYRISSVTAVNSATGETVDLTLTSSSDAGNNYTFTMPVGEVHITAKFYQNLFLLGTVMGRTTWCAAGPEFTFDETNDEYYLDVYFKGMSANDPYNLFNLATATDNIDWTNRDVSDGNWGAVQGRLFAASPNMNVGDGSTATLYGDNSHNDMSFRIHAGVYRIKVNHAMNQMTITQIYPTMSFNPVSNSTVQLGDEVHITSDLQSIVHTIAERYGMHDDHGGPCEQNAIFYSTTNGWDDEVQQELEGSVTITELGTTTVESSAVIGLIIVDGMAVYNVVPVSHSIEAMWSPQDAGSVSVVSAANEGQTVTFSVQANAGYSLSSLTVSQDSNAQPIDYTDNGDGTYTFTMPADDVIIMANFSTQHYNIITQCTPPEGGSIDNVVSSAAAGETVTFTVTPNIGWTLTGLTVTGDSGGDVTVTDNGDGTYSFTMPEANVTVTANYGLTGVIFKIVTDPSEIVEGEYYTIINRKYDRVLNSIAPDAANNYYSSTDIVGWVTPGEYDYVKLDGRACFFSPEDVTGFETGGHTLHKVGYLKTSGGYIGREPNVENNEYGHLALFGSKDDVKPFSMSIDTYGAGSTDHFAYIFYDHQVDGSFPDEWQVFFDNYSYFEYYSFLMKHQENHTYNTWLYKPAEMYNITLVVTPDGTGSWLELYGGAVGNAGAEGSTIIVVPVAGEGYALSSLVVTNDGTGEVVEATPNIDGSYSFIMPGNDVTITAHFETGFKIETECEPEDGGEIIVVPSAIAGRTVTFEVWPNDDYVVTSVTVTTNGTETSAVDVVDNENGTYSFVMPASDVIVKVVFDVQASTLQYIEKWDTYASDTRVTVSDELIGTWMAKQYLWAKDQQRSNVYLERDVDVNPSDFLRNHLKREVDENYFIPWQPDEWDQSNWVMLDFSQIPGFEDWEDNAESYLAMREAMQAFVDNRIEGGTITGRYYCEGEPDDSYSGGQGSYPKVQHIIVLEKLPEVVEPVTTHETSLGYPGYVQDPKEWRGRFYDDPSKYSYNHYMSYNFERNNTSASGTHINESALVYWREHGIVLEPEARYFFMTPKDQEVAQVCGVWVGQKQFDFNGETIRGDVFDSYAFSPEEGVNQFGFYGAFYVPSWDFNRLISEDEHNNPKYGKPGSDNGGELEWNTAYIFHAAIQYTHEDDDEPSKAPRRDLEPYDSDPEYYIVYPLDLMKPSDSSTAVREIRAQESVEIDSIRFYNVMGQESETPFDGINIEVIRYKDGSMISRKVLR